MLHSLIGFIGLSHNILIIAESLYLNIIGIVGHVLHIVS